MYTNFISKFRETKFSFKFKKRFLLVLPYVIISLLLLIIPMLLIIIKTFMPTSSGTMNLNWSFLNNFIFWKIFLSIGIGIMVTIICVLLAYPFAYMLSLDKSKNFKIIIVVLITAPIWSSFLIKLIGLKTFFDIMQGYPNSTFGHIFTIIGLVYIYVPFMILPIYNVVDNIPPNIVLASKDLGYTSIKTFFKIVVPYTKQAFFAGIALVFLPAVTTVAIPQFLNNSTDAATIGDIIVQDGEEGLFSDIALARASALSIVSSLFIFVIYGLIVFAPKIKNIINKFKKEK